VSLERRGELLHLGLAAECATQEQALGFREVIFELAHEPPGVPYGFPVLLHVVLQEPEQVPHPVGDHGTPPFHLHE